MRQLSFAFLAATDQVVERGSDNRAVALAAPTHLQRIDHRRNMARFYALAVERDLFGRVVVVRQWGRIGTAGRTRLDEHPDEGRAVAAMMVLENAKRSRGYRSTGTAKSSWR